jgi:hypothetical protein
VLVGVRADGRKELVALADGYRESTESWADLLGLPHTREQRYWSDKITNALASLRKSAPDRTAFERQFGQNLARLTMPVQPPDQSGRGQPRQCACGCGAAVAAHANREPGALRRVVVAGEVLRAQPQVPIAMTTMPAYYRDPSEGPNALICR